MKKALLSIALIGLATSCFAQQPKKLKAEGTLDEWSKHLGKLEMIKRYVASTNLPHQDVVNIAMTIDSIGLFLGPQLHAQLQDSSKKVSSPKSK